MNIYEILRTGEICRMVRTTCLDERDGRVRAMGITKNPALQAERGRLSLAAALRELLFEHSVPLMHLGEGLMDVSWPDVIQGLPRRLGRFDPERERCRFAVGRLVTR